jgi:hypothetical protein
LVAAGKSSVPNFLIGIFFRVNASNREDTTRVGDRGEDIYIVAFLAHLLVQETEGS